MVFAFLINGMVGWPLALVLFLSLVIDHDYTTALASAILFITGLATMAAVSHRERRRNVVILRWISVGLNAVLICDGDHALDRCSWNSHRARDVAGRDCDHQHQLRVSHSAGVSGSSLSRLRI